VSRGGPERLDELLGSFLKKHGLEDEVEGQAAVRDWDDIVGERIARVARPTGLSRGVLYVEVRSSAWMNELNLMRHHILARLNAGRERGRVERILFRLAETPSGEDGSPE
jgi:predicted nucleic acid-binding Zn ribbon protein